MLVAFANIYADLAEAITARRSGGAISQHTMHIPTAVDGLRSIAAIKASAESANAKGTWTDARPMSLRD